MGGEGSMVDAIVFEFKHTNIAIGRCAGKETASFMGGPSDDIDRRLMQGEVVDSLPLVILRALFLPDENLAVVASRRQDVAVLGMRPGDAPNGTLVSRSNHVSNESRLRVGRDRDRGIFLPLESLYQTLRFTLNLKDLDCPVT